jgi:hypothetical protein
MTDKELVRNLIAWWDESRLDAQGGYPSDWQIWHGAVIWAKVDHDWAPTLEITELRQFLEENIEYVIDSELENTFQSYTEKRAAVEMYFTENQPRYI